MKIYKFVSENFLLLLASKLIDTFGNVSDLRGQCNPLKRPVAGSVSALTLVRWV